MTIRLNTLRDNPGARQARKRVGRGYGSGLGKTSGHGQKGQKARSGVAIKAFEGGQMPLQMRLPKRGFKRGFVRGARPVVVNLGMIQKAIDSRKLSIEGIINADALCAAGLVRSASAHVRLMAKGELTSPVKIEVVYASKAATASLEKCGGQILIKTVRPEKSEASTSSKSN